MSATVVKGFGRGSKLLGIPTANMCTKEIGDVVSDTRTGIYLGYTMLKNVVYPAVVSIGWNPYFDNDDKTVVRVREALVRASTGRPCRLRPSP